MAENNQGVIKITETAEKYILAIAAKLHLQITGENFFYGSAALEKSVEIKSLVEDLRQIGIGNENVMVKDVSLQTETGIFNKSSKSNYKIVVHIKDLELMSEALGVIASQKNCQQSFIEWIFDEDEARVELAKEALKKAKRKAEIMMEAIGYKIAGIKECSDVYRELPKAWGGSIEPQAMRMKQLASVDIGANFQNENKVSAQVSVEFFIEKSEQS